MCQFEISDFIAGDRDLQDKVNHYPTLFTKCSSCDVYQPWTASEYSSVAKKWLDDGQRQVLRLQH